MWSYYIVTLLRLVYMAWIKSLAGFVEKIGDGGGNLRATRAESEILGFVHLTRARGAGGGARSC